MNHLSSLSQRIADLVHPRVRARRLERLRHESFARARLPVSLAAVVCLPAYLATGGVPGVALVLALACLMTPLAAIALLSRTGSLRLAQSVWLAGLFGFAAVLVPGLGLSPGTASALLLLAPLEAYLAGDLVLLAIATGAAGAFTLAVPFAHRLVTAHDTPVHAGAIEAVIVVLGLVYASGLMIQSLRLARLERETARATQAPRDALDQVIGDLVLHHDRSGAVIHVGGGGATDFGIGARDLAGRGFFERVHVADRPIFLKALSDATRDGGTQTASLRLRGGSVASRHGDFEAPVFHRVEWRGHRLEGETEASGIALVALVREIAEAAPAPAPERAEALDAWQDRFLATVSHELRTPLNAIIGFSEMLAHPDLAPRDPAKAREYAQIIHTSGQHLLSVVNTILDASKLESGRFEVQPESFDVVPLVQSCCDMMSLKAEQAGIAVDLAIAPDVRALVADKRACKQILINLLSNAVKFTPAGGRIRIAATLEGETLSFAVADTGIGIGAPDLPRLGDAFFQARNDYARPFEGTGLGLSVVRGLVGLHGGTISIESAQGEGTLVTVRLPRDGRPAAGRTSTSARIEAIPRRREAERAAPKELVSPVKKIA